jgi:hypothetical protein
VGLSSGGAVIFGGGGGAAEASGGDEGSDFANEHAAACSAEGHAMKNKPREQRPKIQSLPAKAAAAPAMLMFCCKSVAQTSALKCVHDKTGGGRSGKGGSGKSKYRTADKEKESWSVFTCAQSLHLQPPTQTKT